MRGYGRVKSRSTLCAGFLNDKSSLIVAGECVGTSKSRMGCNFKCVASATSLDLVFVN